MSSRLITGMARGGAQDGTDRDGATAAGTGRAGVMRDGMAIGMVVTAAGDSTTGDQ